MTGRFRNLEFDDGAAEQPGQPTTPGPRDETYYLEEAGTAFEAGRFEAGLRSYARVLEFNPRNATAWLGQVRMLLELGEAHEARLWADKALETCPDEPDLLAVKAVALARAGDLGAALAFSDASVELEGGSWYVWLARADVLLTRRERAADPCFDKALALASFHWFAFWLAARIHVFHHQFAKALSLAKRGLEVAGDRAVLWMQLGECQLALGLSSAAGNAFAQAHQLDPNCVPAERMLEARAGGWGPRLRGLWRRVTGE